MSTQFTKPIFCCSAAKIAKETISNTGASDKLLQFVTDVLDGKLPCRPQLEFILEDSDVGEILFSVTTTESNIAHSSTEYFCKFYAMGPEEGASILMVQLPKNMLRKDFEIDKEDAVCLECEEHDDIFIAVKILNRMVKEEKSDTDQKSESESQQGFDSEQMSDPNQISDPDQMPELKEMSDPDDIFYSEEISDQERGRRLVREWL